MPKPTPENPVIQPSQKRSRVTFEIIIEATTYLIGEIGLSDITTNKIADRAGVNINSLYQYFLDKNAIIHLLTERIIEENTQAFLNTLKLSRNQSNAERALEVIEELLNRSTEKPDLYREIFPNIANILGPERDEEIRNYLAKGMREIIPDDLYPSEVTKNAASQMLVTIFISGTTLVLAPNLTKKQRKLMSDELRHMILRYIGINELSPRNYKDYFFYVPSEFSI